MCGSCGVFELLGSLFGYLVQFFYMIFKNFGVAIIFFTIVTRLMLFPLNIKQLKSTAAQQRLQPKLKELQARYGNNKQAYNMAVQELYQKEGVSMGGGCLPMLLQFPLFFGMYAAIRQPLTNVMHLGKDVVAQLCQALGISADPTNYYNEINVIERIREIAENGRVNVVGLADTAANSFSSITGGLAEGLNSAPVDGGIAAILGDKMDSLMDLSCSFRFLGLDLLQVASLNPMNMALILAVFVVVAQIGGMIITNKINKVETPQAGGCNPNVMGVIFGGMSFFFALSTPAAFPLYWSVSSLLGPVQTWITKEYFGPSVMNARAEAERNARLKLDEGDIVRQITAAKGELKLKPMEPSANEKSSQKNDGKNKNKNNNNNGNNKNNKKNKGGNSGEYVGKKK
ncbi:MAG: YidC/Oxa1 family membrane protein insertase [Ruminococcaceae bacterium]|nr:YidC/Oxa1 family membrane protein insertase [Oscillospiraceae bacterium]